MVTNFTHITNKILQIFWTHTQFLKMVPNFTHFTEYTQISGILEPQTRAPRQGDFMDNPITQTVTNEHWNWRWDEKTGWKQDTGEK
jgi:hypothetical protein